MYSNLNKQAIDTHNLRIAKVFFLIRKTSEKNKFTFLLLSKKCDHLKIYDKCELNLNKNI